MEVTNDDVGIAAGQIFDGAKRSYAIVFGECGILPGAPIFVALTFTLATGDPEFFPSVFETMQGIRRIKTRTFRPVSNESFQIIPEQSIATITIYLPQALYFNAVAGRELVGA